MTEVLLINPPRQKNGKYSLFNNALLWIASFLEQNGVSAKVIFLHENFENKLRELLNIHQPKFVGISMKWWDTLYPAEYIANLVKNFDPNIFVFCGGQTASYYNAEILKNSAFDAVISGDGEIPVLNLVKGKTLNNISIKKDDQIITYPQIYTQNNKDLENSQLSKDITSLFDDWDYVSNYIWTGKGCAMTCFFCGGGREGQKNIFNRTGYIYRSPENIINDIEILTIQKNDFRFMLDFDPLASGKEAFYKELFKKLPKKKYNCEFYFWKLPSEEFIDLMSETFNGLLFGFDLQIFSESLRKKLAKMNFIKPIFYTNDYFESILKKCLIKKNILVNISGLIGTPFETSEDIKAIYDFSNKLEKFPNIYSISFSPITLEPASPILLNPSKFDITCLRKTYEDFRDYTKEVFENNLLETPFSSYTDYLKYTGMVRNNYNEELTYEECFKLEAEISEKFNRRFGNLY